MSAVLWVRLVKNVEVVEAGVALHERTDLGDERGGRYPPVGIALIDREVPDKKLRSVPK